MSDRWCVVVLQVFTIVVKLKTQASELTRKDDKERDGFQRLVYQITYLINLK